MTHLIHHNARIAPGRPMWNAVNEHDHERFAKAMV